MHIPTAYGGIVITSNLPGNPRLNLTADDVAKIYSGQIRKWNDPQLVDHNPGLRSVDFDIVTFHRAEGSGTTFGFISFLTAGSAEWRASTGADFSAYWPVGDGREGNNGVVEAVVRNLYSIGYADYNVVVGELAKAQRTNTQIGLAMAALYNSATRNGGNFVLPTLESIGTAVASAAQAAGGNDLRLSLIYAPGSGSYPMATATYIVLHQHQPDAEKAHTLQAFLLWGVTQGQEAAAPLGYVPLPAIVQQQASRLIRPIDGAGQR